MALGDLMLRFEASGIPPAAGVVHFELEEALDEPFRLELELALAAGTDVDPSAVIGADAVLTISRTPLERRVCGVVENVMAGKRRPDGSVRLDLVVKPAAALLGLRRNTRMFQHKSVPDILDTVLGESLGLYGRSASNELTASYPTREYCLQYQESDLDFVHRLMEEEGIHYLFDHAGGTELMVLRDRSSGAEPIETTLPGQLTYEPHNLHVADIEPLHRFLLAANTTTTAVALNDVNWTLATHPVTADESGSDKRGRTRESYEHGEGFSLTIGDYAGRSYSKDDAARQASVRKEAHETRAEVGQGISRAIDMTPGKRFSVVGHPEPGFDGEYLIVRVHHDDREPDALRSLGADEPYHNRFECIPFATPHRPPRGRTQKPRIPSMQTAVVTGPGEEIYTDEWGRVRVQFGWDRDNPANETSSTWVRVAQAWSGGSWGHMWIPRVGIEVVVQFVDGDPDRPVVTGCLYDADHKPPYPLPAEKTKSTIKSNSSPGGGGFNEMRFEDKAGSEEVFWHAQKDMNRVTLNNETITVGVNQDIVIGNDQEQTIGVNQVEDVGVDQTLTVGSNRSIDVGANFTETIGATSTITVSGHATETLDAGETQTVNAGRLETVNGGETRTINGGATETINGGCTQTVNGPLTQTITGGLTQTFNGDHINTVTGALSHTVTGGIVEATPSTYAMVAIGGYTLDCPAGGVVIAPGGWTVIAPDHNSWIESVAIGLAGGAVEALGGKISITGVSLELTGVEAKATGMSIGLTGLAVDYFGIAGSVVGMKVEIGSLALTMWGAKGEIAALQVFI